MNESNKNNEINYKMQIIDNKSFGDVIISAHQQEAISLPEGTSLIKMHAYLNGGEGSKTTWRQAVVEELGSHQSDVKWVEGSEPFTATWEAVGEILIEDAGGNNDVRQFDNIIDGFDGVNGRSMRGIELHDLKLKKKADVIGDRSGEMKQMVYGSASEFPYPNGCTEVFLGGLLVVGVLVYGAISLLT